MKSDAAVAASKHAETANISRSIQAALKHHQAGQFPQAEVLYQQILQAEPNHPDALHLLGVLNHQMGNNESAVKLISRAINANPSAPSYYCDLGSPLLAQGQLDAAAYNYRQALLLKPNYVEAHSSLGATLQAQDKLAEAIEHYRKALSVNPDFADAHFNLGNALKAQGELGAAVVHYHRAIKLKPGFAEAYNNIGAALKHQGKLGEAVAHYHKALDIKPDFAEAHNNLGVALMAQGKLDEAVESLRRALALKPDYAEAHNNLGTTLHAQDKLNEAIESLYRALALKPDYAEAHNNLGNALKDQGRLDEAIEHYRDALSIKPDFTDAHSNLLFTLNYHPDLSAEDIYKGYQEYDALRGVPLQSTWRAHNNDTNPNRRLRVGYVSPDFRHHSCRNFLEPLLAHHDKAQVEVYAYAELSKEDYMTARYQSYVEHWVPTNGMSDEALAERISSDGIDILVELAGHTAGNRLLTFARKPAPVSVSWLGYGYTTGLGAIDHYLTDEVCAPTGSEGLFAEHPWRIANPAYAYRPNDGMGEVNALPAQERGYVTFGTLTRAVRINQRTIRVWSETLKAVPNSRLVMDSLNFKEPAMQERTAARFAECGISRDRLEMGFHSPPWDILRGIDIGLDCFPHNSGSTLFETLYMGVPYVTLAGRPSVGRLGSCILQGVGHPEWIADSEDGYVAKAVGLAGDLTRLSGIRTALRGQMEGSPLMDEAGFAHKVEEAYRGMWKVWCEKGD